MSMVAIEFADGFPPDERPEFERYISAFNLFALDETIVWRAAQIRRLLRQAGTPIRDNDLLIGATALHVTGYEVVTRNSAHFERIPGLAIVTYWIAKAFRGELVPQDPSDEPAEQLLARLRAQREAEAAGPKAKKNPKSKKPGSKS